MPRGGARPGAGRKPKSASGPKALAKAAIKHEERKKRAAPAMEAMLDSLEVMRGCLHMAYNEIPEFLKQVRDVAAGQDGSVDGKLLLESVRALRSSIVDCHTIAKDIAPYEHRRLAGEKPLDQDKPSGPPVLTLTAAEIAQ
jgi:hypothetical protein